MDHYVSCHWLQHGLSFENDHIEMCCLCCHKGGGRVYIKGVANGEKVTFTVYGKEIDAVYERESVALEVIPPSEPEIIVDESLPKDFCEWIKAEKSGIKSVANLKITKNGIVQ